MRKYLRRNGIALIIVAAGNCLVELLIYCFGDGGSGLSAIIQTLPGILLINALCIAGGIIALIESIDLSFVARFHHMEFIIVLIIPLILLTTPGSFSQKINALLNLTTIPALALLYTLALAQREEKQWKILRKNTPAVLDLRLGAPENWFNTYQVGPVFAVDDVFVSLIDRFVASMGKEAPININLLCAEPVSDMMKDTIQTTLQMHYEEEENRLTHSIAARYRRVIFTLIVSVILIVIWEVIDTMFEEIVYWEIVGNIAAFGLWQAAGYIFYDQGDQFNELLRIRICKHAQLCFIEHKA